MKTVGIVCEYNPLHLGHARQMRRIREEFGPDTAIVCAMSGQYVQRGAPAILDKSLRAQAAVGCGADLVLELPVTACLSSAEGFAAEGVRVLSRMCDTLCFGAETPDAAVLLAAAQALLGQTFPPLLRRELDKGRSFPAARQAALEEMGFPSLSRPNDILAVEYCKAILTQNSPMDIFPIPRPGSYHARTVDPENPSAAALREEMSAGRDWLSRVPEAARPLFAGAALHTVAAGERAVLYRLRTMTDGEFEALPYGGEGLWRKLMRESRRQATLEGVLAAVKSKRYTRTRLDRMVLCAFLGLTGELLEAEVPYLRVLAFRDRGRAVLRQVKKETLCLNAGEPACHPFWSIEKRSGDLYGLFRLDAPEMPGAEEKRRVYYSPAEE